ncbi:G-type lectin S-receptor-like serine/threonine-protein kinase At2g19130 [Helianthus annuus]|uniref:G-type lectin S-receptor-like serine/threonine-protein kinase At2g19130 n=1 Tax=Helianthus annuus TaxID=4232 RepID=UPI001652E98D|nr:G-type lectin S-receptor-like serine/threonine-protein kinase At2g19130 [Helianthus annuus]
MGILLLLCFSLIISFSSGADTIYANQFLSGNQTIISKDGNFELGFFKAGNSSNYYIGIWYKKVPFNPPTVVWVANRETPISDRFSSKFKLKDGNLVLLNESNTPIWSTNMISTATPASVVLHDDGNLVLLYGSSSSTPIWQSFDHPTHTFLPGSKLGYNKRTNTSHVITSWKNKEDPAAGLFSLEIVQNTKRYALKWNRSVEYWTSGPWNGRFFSSLPDMAVPYIYNFSYIDNANESYFTYWSTNHSVISGMFLDVSGQMQQQTWKESSEQWYLFFSTPKLICDVYARCGAFSICNQQTSPFCNCLTGFEPTSQSDWNLSEFSGGCVRKTKLNCRVKEEKPEFIVSFVPVKYLPASHENEIPSLDESACRRSCLDDCSCDGYSFFLERCRLWNNENLNNISFVFVSDDSTVRKFELNIKVASKDIQHPINDIHKKNDKEWFFSSVLFFL